MSYLIRIAIVALLIFGIFSIASSFEGKESIFVENTSEAGILFLNGTFKPDNAFCFTPVQGETYNIALTKDNTRQNIQVSKTDSLSISPSEGENLGLKVKPISTADIQSLCGK
jgi:hypothetical protein